jgi:phospholipid/cholesterol/gamma-HCH transport system substrate-binding protein
MEPDTRYSIIGAIVLALIAAAVMGYVWLSSTGRAADFRFYTVYFERQSLEGLQVGGNVNMRGVTVGRVEQYSIARDNINRVKVVLRVTRETPVRQNTKASVARNIVTGIARINLETPGAPGPELVVVPDDERYPVIPEGSSNLDQITDSVSRLATTADGALLNLNQLSGPQNQKVFAELLVNLRDLASGLNGRLATLDRTSLSIDNSATAFQQSARNIAQSAQRLADSAQPLSQEAGTTLRDAQTALREFTQATRTLERDLSQAVQRLEKDSAGLVRRADDTLEIGTLELRTTAEALRSSAERIARTLDRLQDPKAALLGPGQKQLGPGEEQR